MEPEIAPTTSSERQEAAKRRTFYLVLVALALIGGAFGWRYYQESHRFILYTQFPDADGLRPGSEVRISGVKVGGVRRIRFLEFKKLEANTLLVEVEIGIDRRVADQDVFRLIHKDAIATLRSDGALADRVLDIFPGTAAKPLVGEFDRIQGVVEPSLKSVAQRSDVTNLNWAAVGQNLKDVSERVDRGEGTLGAYLKRKDLQHNVTALNTEMDALKKQLADPKGFGTLNRNDFRARLENVKQLTNQLQQDVNQGKGAIGKFSNDGGAFRERVNRLRERYDGISRRVATLETMYERGSLGKFANEEKFRRNLREVRDNLNKINARLDKGEGSAGKFLVERQLQRNLADFAVELGKTVYDMRQSPFKYVRIRF
jgi:phospholipid/cholesterol/gamma-HCH transport system substrate-binding protein